MPPPTLTVRALFEDKLYLSLVAGVVVALLALTWFTFAGSAESGDGKTKAFTHMHCNKCRNEIVYNPKLADKACSDCDCGGVYESTVGSIYDGSFSDSGSGPIILYVILLVIASQALVYFGYRRLDALRERAEEARKRPLVARCPFCRRKAAYPAYKGGTWTTCFQCKTAYELPVAEAG